MSLYAFHLGQIISTVLGQVDHDGRHGNAARTPTPGETSETDHTHKRRFRHSAIYQTIKALDILKCLYGSKMVFMGGGRSSVSVKCIALIFHKKMTMQYS
jgi:uncharacterized protein with ACT and thioredoxin-like domain